jgi:hypothetical protein
LDGGAGETEGLAKRGVQQSLCNNQKTVLRYRGWQIEALPRQATLWKAVEEQKEFLFGSRVTH